MMKTWKITACLIALSGASIASADGLSEPLGTASQEVLAVPASVTLSSAYVLSDAGEASAECGRALDEAIEVERQRPQRRGQLHRNMGLPHRQQDNQDTSRANASNNVDIPTPGARYKSPGATEDA